MAQATSGPRSFLGLGGEGASPPPGAMRRNFRPVPLDMSLIPGVHKSTAQSRRRRKRLLWCVLPRSEGADASGRCTHEYQDAGSRRSSAGSGSLESLSGTDESWSPLQSPLQQRGQWRPSPLWAVQACGGGSADLDCVDSPLDDMLLRKRRWLGLTRSAEGFVNIGKPRRHSC